MLLWREWLSEELPFKLETGRRRYEPESVWERAFQWRGKRLSHLPPPTKNQSSPSSLKISCPCQERVPRERPQRRVYDSLCAPPHRIRRPGGPQTVAPDLAQLIPPPWSVSPAWRSSQAGRPPVSLARQGTILGIFMMEQYFLGKQRRAVKRGCSPLAPGSPFSMRKCHRGGTVKEGQYPRDCLPPCTRPIVSPG